MRKFYIEAGNGIRYDLQDKSKCFLNSPNGLGFKKNNSYIEVGDYFVIDNSKNSQKQISGELIFVGDWYKNYNEFIKFIKSYDNYRLVYKYDENDYYIDVDIVSIDKGDTGGNKYLKCDIQMNSKSLFYTSTEQTITIEQVEVLPQWDFTFDLTFQDTVLQSIDINNQGQTKSSFEFELKGVVIDPILKLYVNNEKVNELPFDINLSSGESLLFGNKDNDLYVLKKDSGGNITNAFSSLDLSNDNWFKLPIGESSISFDAQGTISEVKFTYYENYEAV